MWNHILENSTLIQALPQPAVWRGLKARSAVEGGWTFGEVR